MSILKCMGGFKTIGVEWCTYHDRIYLQCEIDFLETEIAALKAQLAKAEGEKKAMLAVIADMEAMAKSPLKEQLAKARAETWREAAFHHLYCKKCLAKSKSAGSGEGSNGK